MAKSQTLNLSVIGSNPIQSTKKKEGEYYENFKEVYSNEWSLHNFYSIAGSELDFSRESLEEMFLFESKGQEIKNKNNGFYWGKKHMDITIKMWNDDIKQGLLFIKELYEDETFPNWFLDKVLNRY